MNGKALHGLILMGNETTNYDGMGMNVDDRCLGRVATSELCTVYQRVFVVTIFNIEIVIALFDTAVLAFAAAGIAQLRLGLAGDARLQMAAVDRLGVRSLSQLTFFHCTLTFLRCVSSVSSFDFPVLV